MTSKFKQLLTIVTTSVLATCVPVATAYAETESTRNSRGVAIQEQKETPSQPFDNETAAQTRQRHCITMANMAEGIMVNYQSGESVKTMLQRADKTSKEIDATVRDKVLGIFKETIIEAGTHPRYSSPSYRQKAVTDFSDKIMMRCILAKRNPFE